MAAIGNTKTLTVVIPAYDAGPPEVLSISAEVDLEGFSLMAIAMPAAWTAGGLSFQATPGTGGTFGDVYDDGATEVTLSVAAGRVIGLDAALPSMSALRFIKVRSGTSGIPVNQAAPRTLTLVLKG